MTVIAQFIRFALIVAFPAVHCVAFELFSRQTQWHGVGSAVYHVIVASISAFALIASGRFGRFGVGASGSTRTTVIWVIAIDVDADLLSILRTQRFIGRAFRQNAFSIDAFLCSRASRKTPARRVGTAE